MADRASIASRIARLLRSGNSVAELLARLDTPKDSNLARALENLLNLLVILRALEVAIQMRHGQTPISPRVLQTLDDAVLRCDDLIGDLQAEKQRITKRGNGNTGRVEREHRAWQSLGSRMADESSHLLISLQQILSIEGHETEDVDEEAAAMIEETLRLLPMAERELDFSKTLTTPQVPVATPLSQSVLIMQPPELTTGPDDATSSSVLNLDLQSGSWFNLLSMTSWQISVARRPSFENAPSLCQTSGTLLQDG